MTEEKKKQPCNQFEGGIKSIVFIKTEDAITDSEGRMYVFSDAEIIKFLPESGPNKRITWKKQEL